MKRYLIILTLLAAVSIPFFRGNTGTERGKSARIVKGPLIVWSLYEGKIEARKVETIMSGFQGDATLVYIAPEGAIVSKGDVLVRLDSSSIERDIVKLERDYAVARSELDGLKNAKQPLEIKNLEIKFAELHIALKAEQQYLDEVRPMVKEGLVSPGEVVQQESKVSDVTRKLETVELQMQLTSRYLHPSELERAGAKAVSALQELNLARQQLKNSIIRAPSGGTVIYKAIPVGTDFRTVRIGDSVYPNQPFMEIPDMSNLIVHSEVPEGELSKVQKGKEAFIYPLAYPDLKLNGTVETVGSMAHNVPGQPEWQKFFRLMIGIRGGDLRLKPGMTVTAHILSYHNPDAVLIPRNAVWWKEGKPFGRVAAGPSYETRELKLGMADSERYEVVGGIKPGDEVLVE